jgi:hypothetical protein
VAQGVGPEFKKKKRAGEVAQGVGPVPQKENKNLPAKNTSLFPQTRAGLSLSLPQS